MWLYRSTIGRTLAMNARFFGVSASMSSSAVLMYTPGSMVNTSFNWKIPVGEYE